MPRIPQTDELSDDSLPWDEEGELDFEKIQIRDWFFEQDAEFDDDLYEDDEEDEDSF